MLTITGGLLMGRVIEILNDIKNPDQWRVLFHQYTHSHSTLCFRVEREGKIFYLSFSHVAYFNSFTQWMGVNFHIEDSATREQIIQRVGLNELMSGSYVEASDGTQVNIAEAMQRNHKVFRVDTPSGAVRIFATGVSIGKNYLWETSYQPLQRTGVEIKQSGLRANARQIIEELYDVQEPQKCSVSINLYTPLALCLSIACAGGREFYLIFLGLCYFEGSTEWGNAEFRVGDINKRDEILLRAGLNESELGHYTLYEVKTHSGDKVRIVAKSVKFSANFPDEFHQTDIRSSQ